LLRCVATRGDLRDELVDQPGSLGVPGLVLLETVDNEAGNQPIREKGGRDPDVDRVGGDLVVQDRDREMKRQVSKDVSFYAICEIITLRLGWAHSLPIKSRGRVVQDREGDRGSELGQDPQGNQSEDKVVVVVESESPHSVKGL
jgi:hypothetical protein